MFQNKLKSVLGASVAFFLLSNHGYSQEFTLKSNSIKGETMTAPYVLSAGYGFGCSGQNMSPQLSWENPPAGTRSYVLTVHDPDAPTGIGWTHWVVVNIPAAASQMVENASYNSKELPKGALQTRTDFGVPGYGGPCPPEGSKHRYVFTLTALDVEKLDLDKNSMPALVGFMTGAHRLGSASMTLTYER